MQSVLGMAELVGMLMEHLWRDNDGDSDMVNCCRVNKIFSQEALRFIWRDIESMEKLYYLLPVRPDCLVSKRRWAGYKWLNGNHMSKPDIWKRVIEITPLVRSFKGNLEHRWGDDIQTDDLRFLQCYRRYFPGRPIFPALFQLRVRAQKDLGGLSGLITSCLLSLQLDVSSPSGLEKPEIDMALREVTTLETLRLVIGITPPSEIDILGIMLRQNRHLKTLSLHGSAIKTHHISVIWSFRFLRDLRFVQGGLDVFAHPIPPPFAESPCPLLETLHFLCKLEDVEKVLSSLQVLPSKELRIKILPSQLSAGRIAELLSWFSSCLSRGLEVLHLTVGYINDLRDVNRDDYVIHPSALHPLFAFKSLKNLCLEVGVIFDVADCDISSILLAFPQIEHLYLTSGCCFLPPDFTIRLSSRCFIQMAHDRPELRGAGMLVNNEWERLDSTFTSQSLMTTLSLGRSQLPSTLSDRETAEHLVKIFPCITTLSCRYYGQWEKVGYFLQSDITSSDGRDDVESSNSGDDSTSSEDEGD